MLETMRLANCRAAEQPLPPVRFADDLPEWGHNIADELTKTVFKGIINFAPKSKKYHARNCGQMIGFVIRAGLFYRKEVPAELERDGLLKLTPERRQKLEKASGWELMLPHASKLAGRPVTTKAQLAKFLMRRLHQFILRTVKGGWIVIKYAMHQSGLINLSNIRSRVAETSALTKNYRR